jgi:hypothetical protein
VLGSNFQTERLLNGQAHENQLPRGKADLLRKALDYWLENAPEAQEASKHAKGKKEKG